MFDNDGNNDLQLALLGLEGTSGVEILHDDWDFCKVTNKYFIKVQLTVDKENIISKYSYWYIVVEDSYPKGKVKVYPDANSFDKTFHHQSNNSKIEENNLWRKGDLCLESQLDNLGNYKYIFEPLTPYKRVRWHAQRAIEWINSLNNAQLIKEGDIFELPDFNDKSPYYIFSENKSMFKEWDDGKIDYGIIKYDIHNFEGMKFYLTKEYSSLTKNFEKKNVWGTYFSKMNKKKELGIWIKTKSIPVMNNWQAPNTMLELDKAFEEQGINLKSVLEEILVKNYKILKGKEEPILVIGAPIPEKFKHENSSMHWQALSLPKVTDSKIKRFRKNTAAFWRIYIKIILNSKDDLNWFKSENWNMEKLNIRGRLSNKFIDKNTLIIGAGTIGSLISESLVRAGLLDISIMDDDLLEAGNLSRHNLSFNDVGRIKSEKIVERLNLINPHSRAESLNEKFEGDQESFEKINSYDLFIDCSSENEVLNDFENYEFDEDKIFVSVSIGFDADLLFLSMKRGKEFLFDDFYQKTKIWIENEREKISSYDLAGNGVNCWNPIFPARIDDISLVSSTVIKLLDDFINKTVEKNINAVYKKQSSDNIVGYVKIE